MTDTTDTTDTTDNRALLLEVLATIAPEADLATLDPDAHLQDELDLDSIDFLNFMMGVYQKTGVDIPERDYARVATLRGCVAYLEVGRGGAAGTEGGATS